jgi:ribonuclease P protein component
VGNAVHRNRVKRWLRESIRRERSGLPDVDVVIVARASAAEAGYEALLVQIRTAFGRIARASRPGA